MGNFENLGDEKVSRNVGETELTVKEVANIIEETPDVVRNWMKQLKTFIPLKKNESGYNVFDEEALDRMKLIKQLHRVQNYSIKQIEHYFATGGEAYKPIPKKGVDELLAEELQQIRNSIKEMGEENKQQQEFNAKLLENLVKKLDEQQQINIKLMEQVSMQSKYIEDSLNKRDQQLLSTIREMQEIQKLPQPQEQEKKEEKKSFFSRLFGK